MNLIKPLLLIMFVFLICSSVYANHNVTIHFFYGRGCPHCAQMKPFLEELDSKYDELELRSYEVYYDRENSKLFNDLATAFDDMAQGVPTLFIDNKMFVGFAEYMKPEIESKIVFCIENGCINPMDKLKKKCECLCHEDCDDGNNNTINICNKETCECEYEDIKIANESVFTLPKEECETPGTTVKLPVLGELDASKVSLPVFTVVVGLLDGFNPCAFFVLFFLLSMLIYAKSRKRMLLIGFTFVFFSGLVYFVFMSAWLNLFLFVGQIMVVTAIAGILAVIIALINVKDFFFFKKGVSLTISDSAKPKLFERIRNLLKTTSLPSMMFGTVVLAVAANMYELLCTAGFPMIFTRILTLNNLSTLQYYLYLILYNIVYVIPLATIVLVVTITLGAKKLSEDKGQALKLISGMMMLFLGLILLFRPELLNNILIAFGLIALALGFSFLLIFLKKLFKKDVRNSSAIKENINDDTQNNQEERVINNENQ